MRQVVLDTETTGLSPSKGHRLTEIGCLEMVNRRITDNMFQTYINPEREIDEGAAAVTGLTLEFLQDKPKFHEIVDEFINFIDGAELIIHNAPFDLGFLNHELGLLKHPIKYLEDKHDIIDTLQMARKMHPGQRNSLDALCKRYAVDNSNRELHGALIDSEILAKVYLAMTAGQSSFNLSQEANANQIAKKFQHTKIVRDTEGVVIQANAEELAAHEAYVELLEKESGSNLW